MPEPWIVIPRWEEFQHRDMARSSVPPWVKTYTRLLSDDDFLDLSHHLRGVLLGIWLEYARSTRQLRGSTVALTRRLGQRVTTRDLESLNHAGFIEFAASKPASDPASEHAGVEVEVEKNPPTPRQQTRKTRRRQPRHEPTHQQTHPHICGINGCTVRAATEQLIAEHREDVHSIRPNGQPPAPDFDWLANLETPNPATT